MLFVLAARLFRNGRAEDGLDANSAGNVDRLGGVFQHVETDVGGRSGEAARLDHRGKAGRVAELTAKRLDLRIAKGCQLLQRRLQEWKIAGAIKLERKVGHH